MGGRGEMQLFSHRVIVTTREEPPSHDLRVWQFFMAGK
jgi:hypothetical protein